MLKQLLLLLPLLNSSWAFCSDPSKDIYYGAVLTNSTRIDSIVVNKASREMQVFCRNKLVKKYRVRLGLNPVGPKLVQGDYKTPEGLYHINLKNPNSQFHKGIGISYPNKQDIARAKRMGRSPGGDVIIHGLPNGAEKLGPGHYVNDWTWGCIALRNEEVDELFLHVSVGIPILIRP